jgi:endo-1,3(4)-beta-glucanase
MIPVCPISTYTRSRKFAIAEWNHLYGKGFKLEDPSWTGVIRGNQATFDPEGSFGFFSSNGFQDKFLMDGDSRAYYLLYAAMLSEI